MSSRTTRREFVGRVAWTGAALSGASAPGPGRSAIRAKSPPPRLEALLEVTRGGVDLTVPPGTPPGETWRYGLAYPFQVAPRQAAVFANIKGARGHDFEIGSDVVVFDDLARVSARRAVAITRNHQEPNPNSSPAGKPAIMVKYPVTGGFVPLGARRADGTPHPHAGTGFGVANAYAWTPDREGPYRAAETYEYFEVQQYRFDGAAFRVTGTEKVALDGLLPGWWIAHPGMTHGVPDGDDFLLAMLGRRTGERSGSGVMRWSRSGGRWRAVSFVPIQREDNAHGPSLTRDVDGSLIFCAAGTKFGSDFDTDIRLWRSRDGGATWKPIVHVHGAIAAAPVSINRAADGRPYVAGTLYEVLIHPVVHYPVARRLRVRDPQGRHRGGGRSREKLALWPVDAERTALEIPILARDCRAEFGPTASGHPWRVDHPVASTVQLGDGAWHDVIGYRICDEGEVLEGVPPSPRSGAYLEEVRSRGKVVPPWRF